MVKSLSIGKTTFFYYKNECQNVCRRYRDTQYVSVFLHLLIGASEMLGLGNKINYHDIFNLILM